MEASERQQLPLDGGDAEGTVRALDDRIVIEALTVEDERAAHLVRERQQLGKPGADTVRKAIEIGARVLDREETAANVDYVRAEFERHSSVLRERMTKSIEAGDQALAERIAESFDGGRDGSVQKEIEAVVEEALEEQRDALMKLFKSEDGANPLFDYKDTMVRVFKELSVNHQQRERGEPQANRGADPGDRRAQGARLAADRRVAEEAERGTAQRPQLRGDGARTARPDRRAPTAMPPTTSATRAPSAGGKKGDTVVEFGASGRPLPGDGRFRGQEPASSPRTTPGSS